MLRKILLGLLGLIALVAIFGLYKTHTEPADLWLKTGVFADCPPRPSCVSSTAVDEPHHIAPLNYPQGVDNIRTKIEEAVRSMPGAHIQTANNDYLHVVFVTATMRYHDDLELLMRPAGIEVRSVSRFGYGDHGVNRARVEALRTAFEARLNSAS